MKETAEQISENSLNQVKNLILDFLKDEDITILLFGSRARGDDNKFSDIDIGIIPKKKYDRYKLTLLREKIDDMNIPYKVEIVDLSSVSEGFKESALKESKVWK